MAAPRRHEVSKRFARNVPAGGVLLAFALFLCRTALGQGGAPEIPRITIEQATSRTGRDFLPTYENRVVRLAGQVSDRAYWDTNAYLIPVRDEEDFGILLSGSAGIAVEKFEPGDMVEATGRLASYRGMPVLFVSALERTAKSEWTGARQMSLAEGLGFRSLGLPVEIEGRILKAVDDGAAESLTLTDGVTSLKAVLYKHRRDDESKLARFQPGDRVRVNGIVTQDAALPPYDRYFQLTIPAPGRVVLIEASGMIPSYLLLSAALGIGLVAIIWWVRDQRRRGFRATMKNLNGLGEEILAATSLSEMTKRVEAVVPPAMRVSRVSIYLYDRKSKCLELIRAGRGKPEQSIHVDKPGDPLRNVVSLCFRNSHAVAIPDTRRSDLFKADRREDTPRSLLAVPMLAQDESLGVILLEHETRLRYFHHEEQASAQHLANQIAASLRLLEQRSFREQLFKSEKLAATGQLISGVVNDLRNPVEAVLTLSQLLLFRGKCELRELRTLAAEAQRTAEIVARLISFGRNEDVVAKPIDLNGLLDGLLKFREREWKALHIEMDDRTSRDAAWVVGAQGQLEQVFLNILLYAERCVAESGDPHITVGTSLLGRRVLAEIGFPMVESMGDPFLVEEEGGGGGLSVLRGIVQSHGGEIRFEPVAGTPAARIDIELPRAQDHAVDSAAGAGSSMRGGAGAALTAVIVDPDVASQRAFVSLMAQRGHRAIPVSSPDEALDLAQRVKCDMVACASRLPGFTWTVFYEKVRPHTDDFILLLDGADLAHKFGPGEGYILRKPIQDIDLERILVSIGVVVTKSIA